MSLRRPALVLAVAVLAAVAVFPSFARAQAVAGTLVGPGGEVIEGALVSLVSEDGSAVDRRLTSDAGRFLLQAPEPGLYRVRAERIGFVGTEGPEVRLAVDETVPYRIEATESAIRLEGLEVESEARCVQDPTTGEQVATLWDEARKALTTTRVAEQSSLFRYDVAISVRELRGDSVIGVTRTGRQVLSEIPLTAEDVDTLSSRGFVWFETDGSVTWNAPDARVLLSDTFLEDHCFRPRSGAGFRPGDVGLSFEPIEGRRVPDVAGTFWLDRETAELREIEFRWVNLPWPGVERDATGSVDLERAPNGAWVVRRASLRMPTELRPEGTGYTAVAVREKIFEIEGISGTGEAPVEVEGVATIGGTVTDRLLGGPLAGATVYLSGTDREAVTDAAGRFEFGELRPGLYTVAFVHPWLERLGVRTPSVRVEVASGERGTADLATPPGTEIRARICPEPAADEPDRGLLLGTALVPAGGGVPEGTEIVVRWPETRSEERLLAVRLDSDTGPHFVVCGVPRDVDVALAGGGEMEPVTVRLPEEGPPAVRVDVPAPAVPAPERDPSG